MATKFRHARTSANPLPDAWQAMFYQGLPCFDLDSRLRGHDGAKAF